MDNQEEFSVTGFGSLAVHAGHMEDFMYAHLTPIYATSTFTFDTAEQGMKRFEKEDPGYIYSRWGNPSFSEAEEKICAMEAFGLNDRQGRPLELKALLHSSGQAAFTTMLLGNLKSGDKILSHYALYGGSYEMLTKVLAPLGIEPVIVDLRDLALAEETIQQNPAIRWIHLETPSNPTLQCVDIEELATLAKKYNLKISVDNTFATPYLQQPFKYGVDYVFHSTTKFLNGHGTSIGGVLIGRDIERMETTIQKWYQLLGGNANPFDSFLLVNGMKTLELRMERHCHNAMEVANFLENHPAINRVFYTGLPSHPDYYTSLKQMRHAGPMMSFEVKGGIEGGMKLIDGLQMCIRAVSLGTTETLISHPASMTHHGVSREEREKFGITDGLVRMSIGIENYMDIIRDLDQALAEI
jgi:methionine-gamma-lyase